jgi:hypothetical protein
MLLACVRGVHKHRVVYHGSVRDTSQALVIWCVRSSSIARLGSWFDSVRGHITLSAVPSEILNVKNLPEASCHNFFSVILYAKFFFRLLCHNCCPYGSSKGFFSKAAWLYLTSRCKFVTMLYVWLHHTRWCMMFGYSCIHALPHSNHHITV